MSYEELPYTAVEVPIPTAEQNFIDAADSQYELFMRPNYKSATLNMSLVSHHRFTPHSNMSQIKAYS